MSDERQQRLKNQAQQRLIESGERERLVQLLQTRLLECGWRDQVVANCKEVVREKGIDNITVDTLVDHVTPKARADVPDNVKRELLQRIKAFLSSQNMELNQ